MSLATEIMIETMKLEGYRWRLLKKKDKSSSINEYLKIEKEINDLNIKVEQYQISYRALKKVRR